MMRAMMRSIFLAAAVGLALGTFGAPAATADDYWDGYWSWYDGSYRPYYSRYYSYRPYSRYYYDDYYASPYYGPYYGGRYYGAPGVGYYDYPGGGGAVRVGPLRFGWR